MARKPRETRDEKMDRVVKERRKAILDEGSRIGGGNENEPVRFHHAMNAHANLELAPLPHDALPYHGDFLRIVLQPIKRAFPKDADARTRVLARIFRDSAAGISRIHDH
jgi:hypothetical protein